MLPTAAAAAPLDLIVQEQSLAEVSRCTQLVVIWLISLTSHVIEELLINITVLRSSMAIPIPINVSITEMCCKGLPLINGVYFRRHPSQLR